MTDIQSSHRLLMNEIHRSSQDDIDMAMVALVDAIDYYNNRNIFILENFFQWKMEKGRFKYVIQPKSAGTGPPEGTARIKTLQIRDGKHWYNPMDQVDIETLMSWQVHPESESYPHSFAWFQKNLYIYPTPLLEFDVKMFYTEKDDQPTYSFDGQTWLFHAQDGTLINETGTWSNRMMRQGFEPVLRAWARKSLYENYYNDVENAAISAMVLADRYSKIKAETTNYQRGRRGTVPTPI